MAKVTGTIVYNKGLGEISVDSVTGLISYKKPSGIIVLNAYPLKENRITGSSYGIASIAAILIEAQNPIAGSSYGIATIAAVLTDSAPTYCNEYQNIYDSYDTKPDAADAAIDNTMVDGWVNDGVWNKIDGIWVFANHITGADSLRNWKNPAGTLATAYNSPAFDQWEGWTGNGSNAYIDLNWNPNSDGVNYTQNSASTGIYIRNNVDELKIDYGSKQSTNYIQFISRNTNITYLSLNCNASITCANTDSRGMYIGNRAGVNDQDIYKNKVRIGDGNNASTGIPDYNIYVLARNNAGITDYLTCHQASLFITGAGLTQDDIDSITDRFHTRMDAHGKAV